MGINHTHTSARVKMKRVTRLGPASLGRQMIYNTETQRWCKLHTIPTVHPTVLKSAVILPFCAHSPHLSSLHYVPLSFITSPYVDRRTHYYLPALFCWHTTSQMKWDIRPSLLVEITNPQPATAINNGPHFVYWRFSNCRVLTRTRRLFLDLNHMWEIINNISTFRCLEISAKVVC